MDPDQVQLLLAIMAVFTGVAAISLLLMLGMMFGMYKAINELKGRTSIFLDRWEPMAETAQSTVKELREKTTPILNDVKRLTEKGQVQMEKIDDILGDLQSTTKQQLQRVDKSLQQNLDRIDETTHLVQSTIIKPVKQIRGVVAAVDAALKQLAGVRRRRPTVDRATHDDEMFI